MAKTKKITIDDLASMVKHGFDEVGDRISVVEDKTDKISEAIGGLRQGQERIELRLDNVAHRFELIELQGRVKILEERAGIKQK